MKYFYAVSTLAMMAFAQPVLADSPAPQEVVFVSNPAAIQRAVTKAAEKVCSEAVRNDFSGDFGSFDDCVHDAIGAARVTPVTQTASNAPVQSRGN